MAKKERASITAALGEAVSDVANAVSVAATGSELGVLELAAEDELKPTRAKRARKAKPVRKKRAAAKKSKRPIKKKRAKKRR
jgi:hypothetical protein